jgi:hypothetical protein
LLNDLLERSGEQTIEGIQYLPSGASSGLLVSRSEPVLRSADAFEVNHGAFCVR